MSICVWHPIIKMEQALLWIDRKPWNTYSASSSKLKVIEFLSKAWEDGTDPVVLEIKENIKNSEYFPSDFIEECVKASYTYSYRAFAKTYGIIPNRGGEDAKKIDFAKVEEKNFDSLNYGDMASIKFNTDYRAYYELDFDGDGENEIGFSVRSGAGGALMTDGFYIFKKNKDGLYERYASGPDCSLRDAMCTYSLKTGFILSEKDKYQLQRRKHLIKERTHSDMTVMEWCNANSLLRYYTMI